jgi:hypothetical protein
VLHPLVVLHFNAIPGGCFRANDENYTNQ